MGEKEYKEWKNQISTFMRMQGESEEFINYACEWFDWMKGSEEVDLVQEYHSDFKNVNSKEVFNFIIKARHIPSTFKDLEFSQQNFNSAFFLYRPLLKLKFMDENLKAVE